MTLTTEGLVQRLEKHTDLGHAKRNAAFQRQVLLACSSPTTSLAQAASQSSNSPMAGLMSLYRFLNNDGAPLSALRTIRAQAVLEGIPAGRCVAIIHDVTQLDFTRHNCKPDRRRIGDGDGSGYEYVPCLALDPDSGAFWGVVHDTLISAAGPDDQDQVDYQYEPLFEDFSEAERVRLRDNHRHQMAVHVNALSGWLGDRRAIHIADREFDDIFILDRCGQTGCDFVIRSSANRNVQMPDQEWIPQPARTQPQGGHPRPEGWICVNLGRLLPAIPMQPYKSLPLDNRNRVVEARQAARTAQLSIGGCATRLYRAAKRNGQYVKPARPVDVNMVVIRELDPPSGVEPLCWVLFTSLPIDDLQQLARVGALYELRWRVEEYFKLLKSGYAIESSRLDDADKTAKLLLLLSLAALVVIRMKTDLGLPVQGRLNDEQYQRIKTAIQQLDNPDVDLRLRLFALTLKFGGWLRRRGDPIGPTVIMRGLLQLLATLGALDEHSSLLEEARMHPETVKKLIVYKC